MKLIYALLLTVSFNAFATVDGHDQVHIVVTNIQDDQDFFIERAPLVGCYGLPQGARLTAWTAEHNVPSNIGCGSDMKQTLNINTLSCAKTVNAVEADDFASFKEITLDISGCAAKNKPKFITMVRTSAKYNFPQKNGKEVVLKLIK